MAEKTRVALGMSGGVDSATSAAILLDAGYDVVGVTCIFIDEPSAHLAAKDAASVCSRLGIQHVIRDCCATFAGCVIDPFVSGYSRGITPSPCVCCNAQCKIPSLIAAADEMNCEKIATGHYARIAQLSDGGRFVVKSALDDSKDQSYMLSLLSQAQLSRLVLPLGGTTKMAVRAQAAQLELSVADKPESQDICFLEGDYADFLTASGAKEIPGNIVSLEGEVLGAHRGLIHYTLGQRKGVGIAAPAPYYVIEKRVAENELVVGFRDDTFIQSVVVADMNWQAFSQLDSARECMVKLRYRSRACGCVISPTKDGLVLVQLRENQPITSPGQFAVFYEGSTVLGGGEISKVS